MRGRDFGRVADMAMRLACSEGDGARTAQCGLGSCDCASSSDRAKNWYWRQDACEQWWWKNGGWKELLRLAGLSRLNSMLITQSDGGSRFVEQKKWEKLLVGKSAIFQ